MMVAALALMARAGPAIAAPDVADRQDYAFAERGFVGTRAEPKILAVDGRLVWDLSAYDFLKGPAPASVNKTHS
jgi:alkyl sulfatase BDS1-like metallo-beta-lactamase superfamily hydrolase